MELKKLVCDSCGGNSFTKRENQYECEYCGSTYTLDNDETVVKKSLTDAKIVECYLEATKYMLKNNHAEEFKVLSKALEMDTNNVTTLVKLGRCYRTLNMQEDAIRCYEKALELDPKMGGAYTNLGTIYVLNGDYKKAAEQYEKGLPLISKSGSDYWTAYANYAIATAHLGNRSKANNMIAEAEKHGYKNGDKCRQMAGIKKQGCYVATAVYGSYDCPEVWVLRRYRDNILAKNWLGRSFIKTYYAVSPALVKRFGYTDWFKKIWKSALDRVVISLKTKGFETTPYEDKSW